MNVSLISTREIRIFAVDYRRVYSGCPIFRLPTAVSRRCVDECEAAVEMELHENGRGSNRDDRARMWWCWSAPRSDGELYRHAVGCVERHLRLQARRDGMAVLEQHGRVRLSSTAGGKHAGDPGRHRLDGRAPGQALQAERFRCARRRSEERRVGKE